MFPMKTTAQNCGNCLVNADGGIIVGNYQQLAEANHLDAPAASLD